MRCFVALWPDGDVRAHLDAIASDVHARLGAGRRIPAENLHLTLAFIGELDPARAAGVAAELAATNWPSFDWRLDHIGHFARARVVWASGPGSEALQVLVADVRSRLDSRAIAYDTKSFVPHVTLLRDADHAQIVAGPLAVPVAWCAARPTLVRTEILRGRPVYRPFA